MASSYHAPIIDLFFADLVSGQLRGVIARPALTLDVHALYVAWCDRKQVPAAGGLKILVQALSQRHQVPVLRKRYAVGASIIGPASVLFLACPPSPRKGFELEWLGDHVVAFRASAAAYRAFESANAHA